MYKLWVLLINIRTININGIFFWMFFKRNSWKKCHLRTLVSVRKLELSCTRKKWIKVKTNMLFSLHSECKITMSKAPEKYWTWSTNFFNIFLAVIFCCLSWVPICPLARARRKPCRHFCRGFERRPVSGHNNAHFVAAINHSRPTRRIHVVFTREKRITRGDLCEQFVRSLRRIASVGRKFCSRRRSAVIPSNRFVLGFRGHSVSSISSVLFRIFHF